MPTAPCGAKHPHLVPVLAQTPDRGESRFVMPSIFGRKTSVKRAIRIVVSALLCR
jgi:hypothetical protein